MINNSLIFITVNKRKSYASEIQVTNTVSFAGKIPCVPVCIPAEHIYIIGRIFLLYKKE